ncbi:hypothetical protein O7635_15395 [Asanoa sp. WMMD1127]|uniref:hypothetical protein n=1 Tax=Asanoa sp. WMMD1127 TaxID=3016107 RepID=UPI00241660EA|nr:hypothetical protein [Asanoa sp. WMMD1127]MDG4823240.1 hypothetical protein [Asanoa sp. WMMD1127]
MFRRFARIAAVAAVAIAGTLHVTSAPAAAAPYGGYHASCSTVVNPGNEYWHHDLSWSEFLERDAAYFANGYRITELDVVGHGITAVWRPGSGAQWVHPALSIGALELLDDIYYNQGLRLAELDRDGDEFYAVWRPGTGGRFWRTNFATWDDFKNQDTILYGQGYRLVDIVIREDNKIGGLWRQDQGSSVQKWNWGVLATGADENNESAFQKLNRQRKEAGYELRILKAFNNDAYRVAVWRYRGGSFNQSTQNFMNTDSMRNWEKACRAQGMRIVTLDVT